MGGGGGFIVPLGLLLGMTAAVSLLFSLMRQSTALGSCLRQEALHII